VDLTRPVTYREYLLNDPATWTTLSAGRAISGNVIDTFDFSDVDVIQAHSSLPQRDGIEVDVPWKSWRRIRISGTLYGESRPDLYDRIWVMRQALDPVLAYHNFPQRAGRLVLSFWMPRGGDDQVFINALLREFSLSILRDALGGPRGSPLAVPWQALFITPDVWIYSTQPPT
jgi:hypothetical protein